MAWRSVVITQPARLKLEQRALLVEQDAGNVRVPLEDVSVLIIDQPQVTLSAALLSACATRQIVLTSASLTAKTRPICSACCIRMLPCSTQTG